MVEALNRSKRSICINLKTDAGRAVLLRLSERSDVLVEDSRPGVAHPVGLDFERLAAVNPRLVHASVSGYGSEGSYAQRPGHDLTHKSVI